MNEFSAISMICIAAAFPAGYTIAAIAWALRQHRRGQL